MKNPEITEINKKIIDLLAAGKTVKEIADIINMNNRTVEDRILEMRRSWHCYNTAQLVVKVLAFIKENMEGKM